MKVETLLPLGKLDPGLRAPEVPMAIRTVYDDAKLVQSLGYDALVVEETKEDPYVVMALAAQATTTLKLGTSVAMAFPRSPTVTAMTAWTLQKLSQGRFNLGLGSQVKGHIRRRFGLEYFPPGPWMREYVQAVRAVWDCWQNGTRLDFQGERYKLNLMVPLFDPGPIEHPDIPIYIAAVNQYMCQVVGEVADGVRAHPVCSPKYIAEIMLPAIAKGAALTNRDATRIAFCLKPLIATAADEESLQVRIRDARARIAFYASTPAYRAAFDIHGLGELADEMSVLSRQQRWQEMAALIDDDVLHTYVAVGTYDVITGELQRRYDQLVSHIEFSIPVASAEDQAQLITMIKELNT